MSSHTRTLEAIKFDRENIKLDILNQLLLPYSTTYISISTIEDAFQAIKLMQVRGAPAIAIVGAFSIVVDIFNYLKLENNTSKKVKELIESLDYLITSRPTAVNLANALNDIKEILKIIMNQILLIKKFMKKFIIIQLNYMMKIYQIIKNW